MLDEEKDNVFKISVPIITNEELERFDYSLETDMDNIVHQISEHISRDREIILLKKVIEKQQKEIEELKEKSKKCEYYEMVADELYKNSIIKDKIKAKIEELEKEIKQEKKFTMIFNSNHIRQAIIKELQSLLEKE